jgi:hypothetical protein
VAVNSPPGARGGIEARQRYSAAEPQPNGKLTTEHTEITEMNGDVISVVSVCSVVILFFAACGDVDRRCYSLI